MPDHPDMPLYARVAVEVMGWSVCEDIECGGCDARVVYSQGEWVVARDDGCSRVYPGGDEWRPDLNIADAWEVFEQLPEPSIYRRGKQWRCHARRAGNCWEDADTAPLAICYTALTAEEVKTDA